MCENCLFGLSACSARFLYLDDVHLSNVKCLDISVILITPEARFIFNCFLYILSSLFIIFQSFTLLDEKVKYSNLAASADGKHIFLQSTDGIVRKVELLDQTNPVVIQEIARSSDCYEVAKMDCGQDSL